MKRTQVQLTDQQAKLLDELSEERGISKAEIIRNALDEWVKQGGIRTQIQQMEEARQAFGIVSSEETDLSERHDDSLTDAYSDG